MSCITRAPYVSVKTSALILGVLLQRASPVFCACILDRYFKDAYNINARPSSFTRN